MRNKTVNKKIIKAMSIGLAAMMAVQPVMTKTAFADDNMEEGGKPDKYENNENEGQACEISSASSDLKDIRDEASEARDFTDYNKGPCEEAVNLAVSAGRDATAENHKNYDTDRGQALNAAEQAVLATDIMKAESQEAKLIQDDRKALADDAENLVEDTKRGYTDKKKLDAFELLRDENTILNNKDLTSAAQAVDAAITEYSNELEELNDAVDVDAALAGVEGTINLNKADIEEAATIPEADELFEDAEENLKKAETIYNDALELYKDKESKHEDSMNKVKDLQAKYDALLKNQLSDNSKLMKAEAELKLAMDDLLAYESDVVKAKENLANTVIGKMAAAFDKEEKTDDDLELIFEDILKYYYFPGLSGDEKVEPSNIRIGEKDGEYFNVEILSEDGSVVETKQYKFIYDTGNMTILEKDGDVDVAEHYINSNGDEIYESDVKNLFEITTAKEGLVIKDGDETKYYQVNDDGEVVVPNDGKYSFDENDVTTEYTIEDGVLVETKIASEATTTVIKTVTLDAAEEIYDSYEEANSGESKLLGTLGTNAKSEGKKVSAVINVEEDAKFSTTIDLSQFEANDNNGKKEQLVDYIKDVFDGGDVLREGNQVTFTYTVKKGVYENENAGAEFSLIDTFNWSGFSNKLTSGGAKVDDLINALRNGSDSSTPSVSYKLTLSGVSYDEEANEIVKNQIISKTNFGIETLERMEEIRKDKEVANSVKAEEDAKKVGALDKQYDATIGYISNAKEEVMVAQGHVQDVIDAINKARNNLENRIGWLNGQMDAAEKKVNDAAEQMKKVEEARNNAEEARDEAIEGLTEKPEETAPTEGTEKPEEVAPTEGTEKPEETAPTEGTEKPEEVAPTEETEKKSEEETKKKTSKKKSSEASQSNPGSESGSATSESTPAPVITETVVSPIASEVAAAPVAMAVAGTVAADTAVTPVGIAGARVDDEDGSGIESAGELLETGDELLPEVIEKDPEGIVKDTDDKNVTIKDEEVPKASFTDEEKQHMNWWWLLLILLLGATGEEMYRRNKEKKEAALAAENKMDSDK